MAGYDERDALWVFSREMTARLERGSQAVVAELRAMREEIGGMRGEIAGMRGDINGMRGDIAGMRKDVTSMRIDVRELREESRAHTGAVLRLLDRFNEGGTAPSTG